MSQTRPTLEDADKLRAESFVGRVLSGRYRVRELIAMGGMGAVYLGEHVLMRKRVAIKILHRSVEQRPMLVRRFEREAVAGAHIQHPNVAAATDFGELECGSYFLILEHIEGTTLTELIRGGPIPVWRAIHIIRQLAEALGATHAMDIVHRDIKPLNVMVVPGQNDRVKLIDFGFAKVPVERFTNAMPWRDPLEGPAQDDQLTSRGVVFGTLSYLAPEAAFGMQAVDALSDLYAMGVIFYEMLAGKHPFHADEPVALFAQQCKAPPPPFSQRSPTVRIPWQLEALVMRLLEKNPVARPGSAADVISALDEICAALQIKLPQTMSSFPPPRSGGRSPAFGAVLTPHPSETALDMEAVSTQAAPLSPVRMRLPPPLLRRPLLPSLPPVSAPPLPAPTRPSLHFAVPPPLPPAPATVRSDVPPPRPPARTTVRSERPPPLPPAPATVRSDRPPPRPPALSTVRSDRPPPRPPALSTVRSERPPPPAPATTRSDMLPPVPPVPATTRSDMLAPVPPVPPVAPVPATTRSDVLPPLPPAPAMPRSDMLPPVPATARSTAAWGVALPQSPPSSRASGGGSAPPRERQRPPYLALAAVTAIGAIAAIGVIKVAPMVRTIESVDQNIVMTAAAPAAANAPAFAAIPPAPQDKTALKSAVLREATPANTAVAADARAAAADADAEALAAPSPPAPAEEKALKPPASSPLVDAVKAQRWPQAADLLIELAERDRAMLGDPALAEAARATATAAVNLDLKRTGRIFEVLAYRAGTAGLDVLYDMVAASGKTEPGQRAAYLLRQPPIVARTTPATRIAFELRDAPCSRKLKLLDRAVKQGDKRALAAMETVVTACFRANPQLAAASQKLRTRLESR